MSFNVGLSGLNAASTDLNVTGNNIANVGTTGFKSSRAEFADVYSSSMYLGSSANQPGAGVRTAAVAQQFTQGNLTSTGNALDLAVNGSGFFVVNNNGSNLYTRDGTFKTDSSGNIVNASGYNLRGYAADADGNVISGVATNLKIDTSNQAPKATTQDTEVLSLNSSATVPTTTTFSPSDATSYNNSTSTSIYDSQGNEHTLTYYYAKTDTNSWNMYTLVDGRNPADPTSTTPLTNTLTFDSTGKLSASGGTGLTVSSTGKFVLNNWVPATVTNASTTPKTYGANGASAATGGIAIDMSSTTQTSTAFAVTSKSQDGYTTGQLSGLTIDSEGKLYASFTNSQSKVIGQVILASFTNNQGLTPLGGNTFAQSSTSGQAVVGTPSSGTLGTLTSGSLEDSNVDLSSELVNLIVAQRNYQANAKTIETENTLSQTIIQIR